MMVVRKVVSPGLGNSDRFFHSSLKKVFDEFRLEVVFYRRMKLNAAFEKDDTRMFAWPLRLFLFLGLLYSILFPKFAHAQVQLPYYPAAIYQVAKIYFEENDAARTEKSEIYEVLERTNRELALISTMGIEMLAGVDTTEETKKCTNQFCFDIHKIDSDFYSDLSELSLVLRLKSDAVQYRQLSLLFYSQELYRKQLGIRQSQSEKLDEIVSELGQKLEELRRFHEQEMKLQIKEYYYAVRDSLDAAQVEVHSKIYGKPLVLDDKFPFLVPGNLPVNYFLSTTNSTYKEFQIAWSDIFLADLENGAPVPHSTPETIIELDEIDLQIVTICFSDYLEINELDHLQLKDLLLKKKLKLVDVQPGDEPRLRFLANPDFEYPKALRELLSEKGLQRLAQLEYQSRDPHILNMGLFADVVPELILHEQQKAEIHQLQVELVGRLKQQYSKYTLAIEDPLTEAYVRCEQVLDKEQLAAVTLKMDRAEFIGRLIGKESIKAERPKSEKEPPDSKDGGSGPDS